MVRALDVTLGSPNGNWRVRFVKVFGFHRFRGGRFVLGCIKTFLVPLVIHHNMRFPMDLSPGSTSSNQPSTHQTDQAAAFYRSGVSALIVHLVLEYPGFSLLFTIFAVSQNVPPSVAPVPQTVQCPFPYASFAVTPIATPSTQYVHDTVRGYPSLQHANPSYPYIPPHTTLASVDHSVRGFLLLSSPTPPY